MKIKVIIEKFKMRNEKYQKLLLLVTLLVVGGGLFVWLFSKPALAGWFNDSWPYRKAVPVTNNTTAQSYVYISVTINTSDVTRFKTNCGDLRFTDYSGKLLPYFILSGCGTASTVVHVQLQTFPAGAQTIYYYYGNLSAANGFSSTDFTGAATNYSVGTIGAEEKSPGPVVYWQFDDGTGTTASDTVATGSATLAGVTKPTWQTEDMCVAGKCLFFDGASSNLTVSAVYVGIQSVSFWVREASSSGTIPFIQLASGVNIQASGTTITTAGITSPTVYVNGRVSSILTANQWNHVEVTTATGFTANSIVIGNVGTTYLQGFLDEVKLYRQARTASQVQADANSKGAALRKGGSAALGAQPNDPLSNGLVMYWKMDEATWSGVVNEVVDSSGNANHGQAACTGAGCGKAFPGTPAKFGNGGQFDGVDNYVSTNTNVLNPSTTDFTVAIWFNTKNALAAGKQVLFAQGNGSGTGRDWLYVTALTGNLASFLGGSANPTTTVVSSNAWNHGVLTKSGNTLKIYINGALSLTFTATVESATGNTLVGINKALNVNMFNGSMDEARIYNRALSPAEVRQLYNFAPGPVGWWKFDEGSGSSVNDSSGNGNAGTWNGAGQYHWTNGKYGMAGQFDGATDYVNVPAAPAINGLATQSGVTVSFWKKVGALSNPEFYLSKRNSAGLAPGWYIDQINTAGGLEGLINTSGTNANSSCTNCLLDSDKTWHFVTMTYSDSGDRKIRLYIDGVEITYNTQTAATGSVSNESTNSLRIGVNSASAGGFWKGSLDDVRIYNYVRTQKQILEDMAGGAANGVTGRAVSGVGKGLLGYWDFNEGQGTSAHDNSGNNNSGTLTNMSNPATAVSGWEPAGKFGRALRFDGINDYVTMGNATALQLASGSAITAWVNLGSNNSIHDIVSKKGANGQWAYRLFTDATGKLNYEVSADGNIMATASGATVLSAQKWYHVVGTYDPGNSITVYVNGVQDAQTTSSVPASLKNSSAAFIVGSENAGASNFMFGAVDEVRVYGGNLSIDEVQADMNWSSGFVLGSASDTSGLTGGSVASSSASAYYCVPGDTTSCAGPAGEWTFDEGPGSATVPDRTGNNNTGTWNGSGLGAAGLHYKLGKQSWAGAFNNNDDYLNVPMTSSLLFLPQNIGITFSTWLKINATHSSTAYLFLIGGAGCNYNLWFNGSYSALRVADGCGNRADFTYTFNPGVWYFLTVTVASGASPTAILYVNGARTASATSATWASDTTQPNLKLGGTTTAGSTFDGSLDQMRIFSYVRTPAQVAWDYNRGKPLGQWDMDECSGTILHDTISATNSATLTIGTAGNSQTAAGTCIDGLSTSAWNNGATGKYGASVNFDGADDNATVTTGLNNIQSVSFWAKPASSSGTIPFVTLATSPAINISSSNLTVSATGWTSPSIYVNGKLSGTLTANAWNHVAVTSATSFSASAITFAQVGSTYFSGQLDAVKIFNYQLTAVQVKQDMNQAAGVRFGPTTGSP